MATYEVRFENSRREQVENGMLEAWYDAIEDIMKDEKTKNTRKRFQGPKAVMQQAVSNKTICWMSAKEAKIQEGRWES